MKNAPARRTAEPPRTSRARQSSAVRTRLGSEVRLVLAGHRPGDRPSPARPRAAVLGRSNVGKSSLLNALLGVGVARVSSTPGRTQALYWYRVDGAFDLVDCPGYGWARTSQGSRELFAGLIEELLTASPRPELALLLVDSRLTPQESDRSMALFLSNAGVPTVVVATKWDDVKPSRRAARLRELSAEYEAPDRPVLPVSTRTGESLPRLAALVRERLALPTPRRGPAAPTTPSPEVP